MKCNNYEVVIMKQSSIERSFWMECKKFLDDNDDEFFLW